MNEWPIIKQIIFLMAYLMRGIYLTLSLLGIENVIFTVIVMTVLFKVAMTPLTISQIKSNIIQKRISGDIDSLKELYGNNDIPILKTKLNIEIERLKNKFSINNASGCLVLLLQFPVIIGLYYVVSNMRTYIPELSDTAFICCGIDMSENPSFGFVKESLVLIMVFLSQIVQSVITQSVNSGKLKINFSNLFSALITLFFAIKVPILIGVYWTFQALCSIIQICVLNKYLNSKTLKYFADKVRKKTNLIRFKKGLPEIVLNNEEGFCIE